MLALIARLLFCSLLPASLVANAGELRMQMPSSQFLVLTIPDDWRPQTRPTIPDQPHTGRVVASQSGQFEMLVSAMLPPNPQAPSLTPEGLRAAVQRAAANAAQQAVERDVVVTDLSIAGVPGYYYFATDRNPRPNEYKYLIQGQLAIRDLLVIFTVLMNGDPKPWSDAALKSIRSARRE